MTEKHDHSICIIAFSTIRNDARVLRQIKYLSPHHDLSVVGYGAPEEEWAAQGAIQWYPVDTPDSSSLESSCSRIWRRLLNSLILILGRCRPSFYERWYWSKQHNRQAFEYAIKTHCDALLANNWDVLPVAVEAATRTGARVVFDSHEYAPLEFENRRYWKLLFRPAIVYFMKKYALQVDASVTVAPVISERYKKEFGLNAIVILNAPKNRSLATRMPDFDHIRLVHHGVAIRNRKLEKLIETLALCDRRFSLHMILVDNDPGYIEELRKLANDLTPGRVMFHKPIPPEEIVIKISEYDIGFCFIAPTNFNYLISLPNKFFDYIMAGLAVCIGPSPSMAEMVHRYGLGWVGPSFEPQDLADTLNRITNVQLVEKRLCSREASKQISAEKEMKKLNEIFDQRFDSQRLK